MRRHWIIAALLAVGFALSCGSEVVVPTPGGGDAGASSVSAGGAGGGGATACVPGSVEACYEGPEGTLRIGSCAAGERRCREDGSGFGACAGAVTPAPDPCETADDEDCDGVTTPCSGGHLWSVQHTAPYGVWTPFVAVDASGAVVTAGGAIDALDIGGALIAGEADGEPDPYIARYDGQGTLLHADLFTAPGVAYLSAVAVDATSNVAFGGYFEGIQSFGGPDLVSGPIGDAFVAKLTGGGSDLWSQAYGCDGSCGVSGVAFDASGNLVALMQFDGTIDLGTGPIVSADHSDLLVMKRAPDGTLLAVHHFGGPLSQWGADVAVDTAGNMLLLGRFKGELDFGGGVMSSLGFSGFVAKLDASGAHVFSQHIESADVDPYAIASDADGAAYVAGEGYGYIDFGGGTTSPVGAIVDAFVVKYDAGGNHVWTHRFGGPGRSRGRGIAADSRGRLAMCGDFTQAITMGADTHMSADEEDLFLAQLSAATGEVIWSQRFGSEGSQSCNDLAVAPNDDIAITGGFEGSLDLGGDTFTARYVDGFVAMFAP